MSLCETTNFLYADVNEWSYACDSPCPGIAADPPARILRLSGTTNPLFANFTTPLSLELSLLCDELHPDADFLRPWRLSLVDKLDEYGIPTLLEGALPLPENIWSDLKESLLLAVRGASVQVRLETREFLEKPSESDPERNFAVTSFGFKLLYRKENR